MIQGPSSTEPLSAIKQAPSLNAQELLRQAGLFYGLGGSPSSQARILKAANIRLQTLSLTMAQYLSELAVNPLEWEELWNLYGGDPQDSFLRYPAQFGLLSELVSEKATIASQRTLRALCVCCGAGYEPYSLAMTLAGTFLPVKGWDISIAAFDFRPELLKIAKNAIYSSQDLHFLDQFTTKRWFRPRSGGWQFKTDLGPKVVFYQASPSDLKSSPLSARAEYFDIILARGLTFDCPDHLVKHLCRELLGLLADDGYLFTAPGEIWPLTSQVNFELRDGIVYIHKSAAKTKSNIFHVPKRKETKDSKAPKEKNIFQEREAVLEERFFEVLKGFPDEARTIVLEMLDAELGQGFMSSRTLQLMLEAEKQLGRSECAQNLEHFLKDFSEII
jgi:chemotaxis protein methyltransferase CheR